MSENHALSNKARKQKGKMLKKNAVPACFPRPAPPILICGEK
jgi:hypothetical protein